MYPVYLILSTTYLIKIVFEEKVFFQRNIKQQRVVHRLMICNKYTMPRLCLDLNFHFIYLFV